MYGTVHPYFFFTFHTLCNFIYSKEEKIILKMCQLRHLCQQDALFIFRLNVFVGRLSSEWPDSVILLPDLEEFVDNMVIEFAKSGHIPAKFK